MFENFIYKIFAKIRRIIYNLENFFIIYRTKKLKFRFGLNNKNRNIPKVIVSLTTFPKRFDKLDLCIKSILNQSFKPDRIIIWLGSDVKQEIADKYLKKYLKYGIEYIIDNNHNYYSHKKYIYAFNKFPDSIIITLDDDLIYSKNTLYSLVKKYRKFPNCIVARRVHKITWRDNKIEKYVNWRWEDFLTKKPSHYLCATTGAGTLFPPKIFPSYVTDYELIKKYAITADDIWLKMMAINCNIKTVWAGNFLQMPLEIDSKNNDSLKSENIYEQKNDVYIKKIMHDFNINKEKFK